MATLVLYSDTMRQKAINWIKSAPKETRVEFKEPKRTLPQNDRMWSMLTDIAEQKTYHGLKLDTNSWKLIFLDGLNRETRIVPNLDNDGFVQLNQSSSKLSKSEMTDLIELMFAWGAENGVTFHDQPEVAA